MAARDTGIAAKLALLLASTGLGLALAEGVARVALEPPQSVRVYGIDEAAPAGGDAPTRQLTLKSSNERLTRQTRNGRRLQPNTVAVVRNNYLSGQRVTIETNSLGYRNRELGEKTRPRVLFLGDSITCSAFLNETDTFVRIVEQLSEQDGTPFETVNAGVGSIGLEDEYAILMETGLSTEPDVVILGFYLNDVESSPAVEVLQLPAALRWSALLQHLARVLPALQDWQRFSIEDATRSEWHEQIAEAFPPATGDPMTDTGAFHALILEFVADWGAAWAPGAWQRMEPTFRAFAQQAKEHDFELLVLGFPVEPQVRAEALHDYPQQRLAALTSELGLPLLDLLPSLRAAARQSEEILFYDQCHHTPTGQRRVAEAIYAFLRQNAAVLAREPR